MRKRKHQNRKTRNKCRCEEINFTYTGGRNPTSRSLASEMDGSTQNFVTNYSSQYRAANFGKLFCILQWFIDIRARPNFDSFVIPKISFKQMPKIVCLAICYWDVFDTSESPACISMLLYGIKMCNNNSLCVRPGECKFVSMCVSRCVCVCTVYIYFNSCNRFCLNFAKKF